MSISPVSPVTGLSFLFTVNCEGSVLRREGQLQKSLCVSSCWWISSPAFSCIFQNLI